MSLQNVSLSQRPQVQELKHPSLGSVILSVITPRSVDWAVYIETYINYLTTNWPQALEGKTREELSKQEECLLHERFETSQRLLLLWKLSSGEVLGLANSYIEEVNKKNKLFVSEFWVNEKYRKQGVGRWLIGFVQDFARFNGVLSWSVEVDIGIQANLFWSKLENLNLVKSIQRNIYEGELDPLGVVWFRHGKSVQLENREWCPNECEISITKEAAIIAEEIGRNLITTLPREFYVSSYKRAIETAVALKGQSLCVDIQLFPELREFFPEVLMGKSFNEINVKYGTDLKERLIVNPAEVKFQGCETLNDAQVRIFTKVEEIRRLWSTTGERVIISHEVAHALWTCHLLEANINSAYSIRLYNLNCSWFRWNELRKSFDIEFLNQPFQKNLWNELPC